jgi:hypothetical protein
VEGVLTPPAALPRRSRAITQDRPYGKDHGLCRDNENTTSHLGEGTASAVEGVLTPPAALLQSARMQHYCFVNFFILLLSSSLKLEVKLGGAASSFFRFSSASGTLSSRSTLCPLMPRM